MHRIFMFGMTIVVSLCVSPVHAQPKLLQQNMLSQSAVKTSSAREEAITGNDVGTLRTRIKEARAEFNKVNAPGGLSAGAPPGTPEYELMRRRFLLRLIASNYDRLLNEIQRTEILHHKRVALDTDFPAGILGTDKPPYSVSVVERVRERLQGAQFKVKQTEISLESTVAKKVAHEDNLKKLEGEKRALLEKIEQESDSAKADTLEWNLLLFDLNRRFISTELALSQAVQKNTEEELALARKELSILGDTLDQISKDSRFTESDLNEIKKRLEDRRSLLEKDLELALTEKEALQKQADKRLSSVVTGSRTDPHRQNRVVRDDRESTRIVQEQLENSRLKVDLLRDKLEFNRFDLLVWELRYAAETLKDNESAERISRMIPQALTTFDKQMTEDSFSLKVLIQKLNELESELTHPFASRQQDELKQLISMYSQREELLLARIKVMSAAKSVFERLAGSYVEGTKHAVSKAKIGNWQRAAGRLWNYELFATEDVYTVDGKEIRGERGVTIAKVFYALALLILGWIASSKITKIFFRHAVKRYDMPEGGALLARRWLMALIFVILLLTSLHLVRIPLTAFAFLGGAIVIGVGFGIQDLMKNLMSGIMMLAERPFRIGDLIDVGGVRGRVTSIGIRSSTIRDVTGIETLVPNSTFVEKNVTNWTYSTQQVRSCVTVGVAYGSNIAVVKKQLLKAATSQSEVLQNPGPLVTLDDFGADALIFGLYYWIKLDSMAGPHIVSSDLREMIEQNLTSENIVISFPQRDIHIDALKPLRVEIVDDSHSATIPADKEGI